MCLDDVTDTEYDLVVAYQGYDPGVTCQALHKLKSKKKIVWLHGECIESNIVMAMLGMQFKKFHTVFCVSDSIRKYAIEKFAGLQNVEVFYNLLNREEILKKADMPFEKPSHPDGTVLCTVGRLSSKKGQDMIPEIVRLLLDAGKNVYWYLVGEGPLREKIISECRKYGVQDYVFLIGSQDNPYPYIKACSIYIQTSLTEGWGLTVQEARILHKPIVVTPVPVFNEQITSGENGLIVDSMTPEALFEGIKTLLDHPEMCEKFVDNLKKEDHDNTDELQKLYDFIEGKK